MAVQKKKRSRARTRHQRSQYKLKVPNLVLCSQCKNPVRPHYVCQECGTYGGVSVIEIETKEMRKKKKEAKEKAKEEGENVVKTSR